MRTLPALFVTTRVDAHGESANRDDLEEMARDIARTFVPIGVEHDPRIPPLGRIATAAVERLEDGYWGLKGTIEAFEEGDTPPSGVSERETLLRFQYDMPCVSDDRSFSGLADQVSIGHIRTLLGASAHTERKKAIEPIPVLKIAMAVGTACFADGFLSKAGSDAWDATKPHLITLFGARRNTASAAAAHRVPCRDPRYPATRGSLLE